MIVIMISIALSNYDNCNNYNAYNDYIKYNFHKINKCVTNNQLRELKDDSTILLRKTFETK